MKYLFKFPFLFLRSVSRQSGALSYATQHAMPPEFRGKWGTEWLHTSLCVPAVCGTHRAADFFKCSK